MTNLLQTTEAVVLNDRIGEGGGSMLSLRMLMRAVRSTIQLFVAVVVGCVMVAILYLLIRTPDYEATALVGPPSSQTPMQIQSALAQIAAPTDSGQYNKFQWMLQSTRLLTEINHRYGVAKILFPGWNSETQRWEQPGPAVLRDLKDLVRMALGKGPWVPPGVDALSIFMEDHLTVDLQTNGAANLLNNQPKVYKVTLKYKDRDEAVRLLQQIMVTADTLVRNDQWQLSKQRATYLLGELKKVDQIELSANLQSILVDQQRTQMIVLSDHYYSFDMIDPPSASETPVGAKPIAVLILSIIGGVTLYTVIMVFMLLIRIWRTAGTGDDPVSYKPFFNPFGWFVGLFRRRG